MANVAAVFEQQVLGVAQALRKRMYSITTIRIPSGDELKDPNG